MDTFTTPTTAIEQKLELKLTVTDREGRLHILDITKDGANPAKVEMLGNNIMLTSQLYGLIAALERRDRELF